MGADNQWTACALCTVGANLERQFPYSSNTMKEEILSFPGLQIPKIERDKKPGAQENNFKDEK